MRCGMDHDVFATECTGCGASLDTEPQRAFNERLWAARQEEAAREAAAEAERARAAGRRRGRARGLAARAMGEALAREVGARERRRLDAELGAAGVVSALRRLLRRLLDGLGALTRRPAAPLDLPPPLRDLPHLLSPPERARGAPFAEREP